jgi:hypothetical protein
MLDLRLFADRRFTAAALAITVAFFALFGFIFLITQYFQFLRGYSPLETGCASCRWRCASPSARSSGRCWWCGWATSSS